MKLYVDNAISPGRVYVFEHGVAVVDDGDLRALMYVEGDDSGTEIYLNPCDAEYFRERWMPAAVTAGRLN